MAGLLRSNGNNNNNSFYYYYRAIWGNRVREIEIVKYGTVIIGMVRSGNSKGKYHDRELIIARLQICSGNSWSDLFSFLSFFSSYISFAIYSIIRCRRTLLPLHVLHVEFNFRKSAQVSKSINFFFSASSLRCHRRLQFLLVFKKKTNCIMKSICSARLLLFGIPWSLFAPFFVFITSLSLSLSHSWRVCK